MYQLLTGPNEHSLRIERLGDLETDHYRISLRLEEVTDDAERATLLKQRHELERRMNIHLRALSPTPEETSPAESNTTEIEDPELAGHRG
jgi:hypothetical protein